MGLACTTVHLDCCDRVGNLRNILHQLYARARVHTWQLSQSEPLIFVASERTKILMRKFAIRDFGALRRAILSAVIYDAVVKAYFEAF